MLSISIRYSARTIRLAVAVTALGLSAVPAAAQQSGSAAATATSSESGPIDSTTMDAFAAANIAVVELRSRIQAELAEPRSKKAETQTMLREKLQAETKRALEQHHITEAEFTQLTRRVSVDEGVRKQFEEAMVRISKRT